MIFVHVRLVHIATFTVKQHSNLVIGDILIFSWLHRGGKTTQFFYSPVPCYPHHTQSLQAQSVYLSWGTWGVSSTADPASGEPVCLSLISCSRWHGPACYFCFICCLLQENLSRLYLKMKTQIYNVAHFAPRWGPQRTSLSHWMPLVLFSCHVPIFQDIVHLFPCAMLLPYAGSWYLLFLTYFLTVFLRYNPHTLQFIPLKWTPWSFSVYSENCTSIT